ncbi:MAG TPA: hypothetical protein VGP94_04485 [Tepidisphaeraceae bacterium]|nr:hypothetical protein [Tepidisphaeraceae bacterium]
MQPAQQRFNLLRVEHRRRYQQGRRTGRNQRWIGFNGRFKRSFSDGPVLRRIARSIGQILFRRRIRSETQFQKRLLARLLVRLGLRSHVRAPSGTIAAGLDIVRMIITLTLVKGQVESERIFGEGGIGGGSRPELDLSATPADHSPFP